MIHRVRPQAFKWRRAAGEVQLTTNLGGVAHLCRPARPRGDVLVAPESVIVAHDQAVLDFVASIAARSAPRGWSRC